MLNARGLLPLLATLWLVGPGCGGGGAKPGNDGSPTSDASLDADGSPDSDGPPDSAGPPDGNDASSDVARDVARDVAGAPTAAFTAPATAQVDDVLVFDASASTSSDGSLLQYSWEFGNRQRGGGKVIAHVFGTAGARSVTLTVMDGAGRAGVVSRTLTVSAAPAPTAQVTTRGVIKTVAGLALEGVTVASVRDGVPSSAVSNAQGEVTLRLGVGAPSTLRLSKAGYAEQVVNLTLPATVGTDGYFDAVMVARDAALALADAATGGTLTGRHGATLTLPAGALVDAAGAAVTGPVQIAITPVDVTQNYAAGFPGRFDGLEPDGTMTPIVSLGVVEYALSAGGAPVQLAPGKTASIDLPLYATEKLDGTVVVVGETTPLWSLDESTGLWVQEGTGTVVASAASPSGLALRATVAHLSWWNCDLGFPAFGPEPKCVYDTDIGVPGARDTFATATICNMLARIGGSRAAAGAVVPPPVVAAYARRVLLPIEGGVPVAVPADYDVELHALALNGTWEGDAVVSGPVGERREVLVKMHPRVTTPPGQTLAIPSQQKVMISAALSSRFDFTITTPQAVEIFIAPDPGSLVNNGTARLLLGTTVLAEKRLSLVSFDRNAALFDPLLHTPGTYTVELTNDQPAILDLGIKTVAWGALAAPPISTQSQGRDDFVLGDVQFDAAGRAVVGYASLAVNEGYRYLFKRAEGGKWTDVSGPLPIPADNSLATKACMAFALDAAGLPVVVAPSAREVLAVQRWNGTAWVAVGPGGGALPLPTAGAPLLNGCNANPKLRLGADGQPVVLFTYALTDPEVRLKLSVVRFDGAAWNAVGPDGSPATTGNAWNRFALGIDGSDRPVVVWRVQNTVPFVVSRFTATPQPLWSPVGGGALPLLPPGAPEEIVTNDAPDLTFDAARNPVVALAASTLTTVYRGVTVYQLVNGAWTSAPVRRVSAAAGAGELILGPRVTMDATGKPVLGWVELNNPRPYFQRWTGAAWEGVGGGDGLLTNLVRAIYTPPTMAAFNGLSLTTSPAGELTMGLGTTTSVHAYGHLATP